MAAEVKNKTLIQNETIILKRECRSKEIFKQLRYLTCLKKKSLIQTSIHIIRGRETMQITMSVNEQEFVIILEDNETVQALLKQLPLTMTMKDLNANEKYFNITSHLPTDEKSIGHIEAGDVMLFGDHCLVVFYESFSSSYRYTRLGKIEDVDAFVELARQKQDITVTLSK